jgi:hypothetical protein
MSRVLAFGSRKLVLPHHREAIWREMDSIHADDPIELLIHGAARGADSIAAQWAARRGIPLDPHPAAWDDLEGVPEHYIRTDARGRRYNSSAGPMRNAEMLRTTDPTLLVAFTDASSWRGTPGTSDMLGKARLAQHNGRQFQIRVVPI